MKNILKKVMAFVIAVASLTMSITGTNTSAFDTNNMGSNGVTIGEQSTRNSYYFYLTNTNENYITAIYGSRTIYYTASVNQGGVTILIRNYAGSLIEAHYFSAGYAPSFSINVPAGKTYYFYVMSSVASPSYVITGAAYINW